MQQHDWRTMPRRKMNRKAVDDRGPDRDAVTSRGSVLLRRRSLQTGDQPENRGYTKPSLSHHALRAVSLAVSQVVISVMTTCLSRSLSRS